MKQLSIYSNSSTRFICGGFSLLTLDGAASDLCQNFGLSASSLQRNSRYAILFVIKGQNGNFLCCSAINISFFIGFKSFSFNIFVIDYDFYFLYIFNSCE